MSYGKIIQQLLFLYAGAVFVGTWITNPSSYAFAWTLYAIWFIGVVISAYYHRFLTHRAWNCPRWLEIVLAVMAAGHGLTPAISWVAVHRKHHRFADRPEDPHGPHTGFFKNAMVSFYDTDLKYATNQLLQDRLYRWQLKWYPIIAIMYYVLWSVLFDPTSWLIINGFAYLGQVTINYIAHANLQPVNRPAVALLLSAETYHKNHHEYPQEARFGKYDLPYLMFIEAVDPQTALSTPKWALKDD